MTIYLHCGGHKTASSFMKTFLRKNKALFESQRIAIHLDVFRDREITAEDVIKLVERDYQNNYQKIVISEDANIIGLMPGIFQPSDRGFFNTNSILKFSNLIAKVNQKYPTKFLLCVRRQDTYLESCYKFRKSYGAKYSLEYFLGKAREINLSWYDVVNSVAIHIGQENCFITPYELLKKSQAEFIATFFESILAIDLDKVIIPPPNNQGASELIMAIINYLDRDFPDIPVKHRKEILSIIRKNQAKNTTKASLLSETSKSKILHEYATSNHKLFAAYIPNFPENYYDLAYSTAKPANNTVPSHQLLTTNY